jgi:hypothetical protein
MNPNSNSDQNDYMLPNLNKHLDEGYILPASAVPARHDCNKASFIGGTNHSRLQVEAALVPMSSTGTPVAGQATGLFPNSLTGGGSGYAFNQSTQFQPNTAAQVRLSPRGEYPQYTYTPLDKLELCSYVGKYDMP